jgi:SAM-dependent methyltransferase
MRESFFIDKDLKRAIKANLTYDMDVSGLRSWFRMADVGYCMNFRPSAAKVVYNINLPKKGKVLDYAAGYGGRLLGAWASENCDVYIGLEPNTKTYENGLSFLDFLNGKYLNLSKSYLYNVCSEDFTIEKYPQYSEYFDMAFSSPPYFNLEVYSDEDTQSYIKFNQYTKWVKGYLQPTINNCIDMLKPGGIFAINIYEDETEHNKAPNIKKIIQLICNERGFKLYKIDYLVLTRRAGNGSRDRSEEKVEPIWYFKKG